MVQLYKIEKSLESDTLDGFLSLLVLEGEGRLLDGMEMELRPGDSVYLPEGMDFYRIEGKLKLLVSSAAPREHTIR